MAIWRDCFARHSKDCQVKKINKKGLKLFQIRFQQDERPNLKINFANINNTRPNMDDLDFCMAIWQPWSSKSQKSEKCRMKFFPWDSFRLIFCSCHIAVIIIIMIIVVKMEIEQTIKLMNLSTSEKKLLICWNRNQSLKLSQTSFELIVKYLNLDCNKTML